MRSIVLKIIFVSCLLGSSANADLVTFLTLNGEAGESTSNTAGAVISITESSAIGNASGTITYLISNLDIAQDGTANDTSTLVFDFTKGAGGASINLKGGGGLNVGAFGITGNGAGTINASNESLTFGFTSGSATLGDGGTASTLFAGFNRVRFDALNSGSESALLSGTDADGSVTGTTIFGNTPSFTITGVNGSTFRVRDFRARLNYTVAVPEPSSFGMLALAAGFFIKRRRRN